MLHTYKDIHNTAYIMKYYSERNKSCFCNGMNGTWWHYTKWNKPDKERQILYNVIYMQIAKKVKLTETESRSVCQELGVYISSIQLLSHVWLFVTPWTAARQDSRSTRKSWSLLKLMSIMSVMPSNHLILCHPLLLPPSIFAGIRWPKYWSFSFNISSSNEYSGLISFRMDWLDLLTVQGTLKTTPSSNTTVQKHQCFGAQLSL